jgi:hypothetical protein
VVDFVAARDVAAAVAVDDDFVAEVAVAVDDDFVVEVVVVVADDDFVVAVVVVMYEVGPERSLIALTAVAVVAVVVGPVVQVDAPVRGMKYN